MDIAETAGRSPTSRTSPDSAPGIGTNLVRARTGFADISAMRDFGVMPNRTRMSAATIVARRPQTLSTQASGLRMN